MGREARRVRGKNTEPILCKNTLYVVALFQWWWCLSGLVSVKKIPFSSFQCIVCIQSASGCTVFYSGFLTIPLQGNMPCKMLLVCKSETLGKGGLILLSWNQWAHWQDPALRFVIKRLGRTNSSSSISFQLRYCFSLVFTSFVLDNLILSFFSSLKSSRNKY